MVNKGPIDEKLSSKKDKLGNFENGLLTYRGYSHLLIGKGIGVVAGLDVVTGVVSHLGIVWIWLLLVNLRLMNSHVRLTVRHVRKVLLVLLIATKEG